MLLDAVDWVAGDQRGLITAAQLDEIGIPRSTPAASDTYGRSVATGAPRHVPRHAGPSLSTDQKDTAALLFAGPDAMLTGASGLRRHRVRYAPPGRRPSTRSFHTRQHRKSSGFAIVERTRVPAGASDRRGFPTAPIARCSDRRRATCHRCVERHVRSPSRRCNARLASIRVARGSTATVHSAAGRRCCARSSPRRTSRSPISTRSRASPGGADHVGLPSRLWNPGVLLPSGEFVAQPDGLIEESMVGHRGADSQEHHSEGDGCEGTLERGTDMSDEGLLVVHIVPRRFAREPRANPSRNLRDTSSRDSRGRIRPFGVVTPCREFERMRADSGVESSRESA